MRNLSLPLKLFIVGVTACMILGMLFMVYQVADIAARTNRHEETVAKWNAVAIEQSTLYNEALTEYKVLRDEWYDPRNWLDERFIKTAEARQKALKLIFASLNDVRTELLRIINELDTAVKARRIDAFDAVINEINAVSSQLEQARSALHAYIAHYRSN